MTALVLLVAILIFFPAFFLSRADGRDALRRAVEPAIPVAKTVAAVLAPVGKALVDLFEVLAEMGECRGTVAISPAIKEAAAKVLEDHVNGIQQKAQRLTDEYKGDHGRIGVFQRAIIEKQEGIVEAMRRAGVDVEYDNSGLAWFRREVIEDQTGGWGGQYIR